MIPEAVSIGGTVGEMIIASVNRNSDRVAFLCEGREYTYREARERISQAGQFLRSLGLKKGDTIAQLARNKPEQWFVMSAAYIMGLRSVMLHAMGSLEDHVFTINDAEAVIAVFDSSFAERAAEIKSDCPGVKHWFGHGEGGPLESFWDNASRFTPKPLVNETQAEDIIRLAYTGGTTGKPKGVMQSSRAALYQSLLSMIDKDWPERPVFLCSAPISHGAGANIIPTLSKGGTFILLPNFKVEQVLEMIPRHKVSVIYLVPTMLYRVLDHPDTARTDLSSLKTIMYGASPASPTRIREAIDRLGPILCQTYGQTEAPSSITVMRRDDHDPNDLKRLSSCGMAYSGIQVAILDDKCQPLPNGDVGEICVKGPIVMSGYWRQPELTKEVFAGGWLHTGDLGYRDELGFYYIVDRKKDMIISGGFNVYPKEIENILTAHPGVASAAVIGVPDADWGEAVKAIVVPRDGATLDEEALISLVKAKKGGVYAPKSIDFVTSLPLTPVGKPDKAVLKKKYWAGHDRAVS